MVTTRFASLRFSEHLQGKPLFRKKRWPTLKAFLKKGHFRNVLFSKKSARPENCFFCKGLLIINKSIYYQYLYVYI